MSADVETAELPLESAGRQLRRAREAAGKTLADISAATKISERLLAAIEESQFSSLPSRIYAIGFSRSYARQLGLDEAAIVKEVRAELDGVVAGNGAATIEAFAPGDPARVPGRRLAITAALGALLVVVVGLVFWHGAWNPAGSLPSILPTPAPSAAAPTAVAIANAPSPPASAGIAAPASPVAVAPAGGAVSISALAASIWVKIYETSGKTLFDGQMALGQTFTLPANAQAPLIWTGRPEALAITVAGKPVPKLSERQRIMKGVPISAAALLARSAPATVAIAPGAAQASTPVE